VSADSADARILSQEQHVIELLARETHTEIAAVQEVFLVEYKKLAAHAHITAYLPLLTSHRVREILQAAHPGSEQLS
jgi:hypothetical protein